MGMFGMNIVHHQPTSSSRCILHCDISCQRHPMVRSSPSIIINHPGLTPPHHHHRLHNINRHPHSTTLCHASSKYAALLRGSEAAQEDIHWTSATVINNHEASVDGSARTLVLSIEDAQTNGDVRRRARSTVQTKRWLDAFDVPGQFVAVRYNKNGGSLDSTDINTTSPTTVVNHFIALASSPYEARATSAALDAAIVEVLVSRNGSDDEKALAELGPGSLIQVSEVIGRGFQSLFNSIVGLQSALEEGRPLLMVAVGNKGIAPVRSALNWTPVLAHATMHPCTLVYAAHSQTSAAYLLEWDAWREAGVGVHTVYTAQPNAGGDGDSLVLGDAIEEAVFGGERGLVGALRGGDPNEAAVVMSGVPGDVAAHLTRRFTHAGVSSERLLFCDFF